MKVPRILKPYIAFVLAFVSLLYAVGDFCGWWDHLSGRNNCRRAVDRLASTKGFPESFIYKGESGFDDLLKLGKRNTQNETARSQLSLKPAVYITRGDISISFKGRLPEDYPNQYWVPDVSPVIAVIGYLNKNGGVDNGIVVWLGTIGDFRRWVEEAKSAERFWAQTVLLGCLALCVAFFDLRSIPMPSTRSAATSPEEPLSRDSADQDSPG